MAAFSEFRTCGDNSRTNGACEDAATAASFVGLSFISATPAERDEYAQDQQDAAVYAVFGVGLDLGLASVPADVLTDLGLASVPADVFIDLGSFSA